MAKRSKKKTRPPETGQVKLAEVKEIGSVKSSGVPWRTILQALVIAAAVLWIYWPALHGDWLSDDALLVRDNTLVHDPFGLWKIWFEPGRLVDFQPFTVSVVWLQWQLWGNHTMGYHLTNVFLHLLSGLLIWRLLSKFHLRLAWLGGLIFAVHPVQVESVAWIAELKNTLSLPPFLLAMCFWIDYEEHGKAKDYWLALGLFLAAMLCKPTMVMFPVVILLYGWWKRGRIGWPNVRASTPFFVVSLVLGLVTIWFLGHNSMGADAVPMGGFFSRLACAGLSLSFYFSKCFLPVGLLPIYPQWVVNPPSFLQFLPWPVLGGVIYWFWIKRQDWGRNVLLGLGFFLINLAPFIGFNAASYMDFTWVMDHVLYIPIIGLIGLVVTALGQMDIQSPSSFRPSTIGLVIVALWFLAFESHNYAKMFINEKTLWTYTFQHNPEAYPAYNNLGLDLFQKGRISEAIAEYEHVLQLKPDYAEAHNNLGYALQQTSQLPEAMEQYGQALQLKPDFAEAHNNLGLAQQQTGRASEAMEQFEQALQLRPDYVQAHNNLGNALFLSGRLPEAIEEFEHGFQLYPDYAEVHFNLGFALQQTGQLTSAIEQYQQALRINPDYAEAYNNLGIALYQTGQAAAAMEQFEQALRIRPDYADARNNLARAQALQKAAPAKN